MALSKERTRAYSKRLLLSRMRLLCNHGFYGLLLMHMKYSVDEQQETAATDGKRITFGADFLDSLSDQELDFVMMHQILHVVLQHCFRAEGKDPGLFDNACDIVVNSTILLENHMDPDSITLKNYGESVHLTPDGREGHELTAEQVYEILLSKGRKGEDPSERDSKDSSNGSGGRSSGSRGHSRGGKGSGGSGSGSGGSERQSKSEGSKGRWDDHSGWNAGQADGAEKSENGMGSGGGEAGDEAGDEGDVIKDMWTKRLLEACEAISIRDPSNSRGLVPAFAQRMLEELKKPQTDWRTILNEFVQEEVVDYSFTPPDRRFADSPFFLPDFNEKDDTVEDILFMIDTSGSMSDEMITAAYSEIKGAIDQFNGKLKGWLGFFDAVAIEPKPFENEDEFSVIRPEGGGGTSFDIIFDYVFRHMEDKPPASIIILTDGLAPFPPESNAHGIPVLWLLNNEIVKPPWGKVARITV